MKTLKEETTHEEIVKRSRFIGIGMKIESEEEFKQRLDKLKNKYPGANHYVFGYVIKKDTTIIERCSDDGEVRHTAGRPILSFLRGRELINCAVVVIRYFGGIKLGVGGLVRAYSKVALRTIEKAGISSCVKKVLKKDILPYNKLKEFERKVEQNDGIILEKIFGEHVTIIWEQNFTEKDSN